ncbi:MAG: glycogen/starch synthase [Candidatus Ancaeobacter aquaticus]|nr:glycogen/starch synthase [Candidatus Ancaeobacter aquaticus]
MRKHTVFFITTLIYIAMCSSHGICVTNQYLAPETTFKSRLTDISSDDTDTATYKETYTTVADPPYDPKQEVYDARKPYRPNWLEMQVMCSIFFDTKNELPKDFLFASTAKKLKEYGINRDPHPDKDYRYMGYLLMSLMDKGIVKYIAKKDDQEYYDLATDPIIAAVWAFDIQNIRKMIAGTLNTCRKKNDYSQLRIIFDKLSHAAALQEQFPIEARYPISKAVALLSQADQRDLVKWIETLDEGDSLYAAPLTYSLYLQLYLAKEGVSEVQLRKWAETWVDRYFSDMKGRKVYMVTPEGHALKGGLGRVMKYHTEGLLKLGLDVVFVEPYYRYKRVDKETLGEVDYTNSDPDKLAIGVPLSQVEKIYTFPLEVIFRKDGLVTDDVVVEVYKGVRDVYGKEMVTYMIRDNLTSEQKEYLEKSLGIDDPYFVKTLYEYSDSLEAVEDYMFTEFFTKAAWKFIKWNEAKRKETLGKKWKGAVVDLNDSQSLLLSAWAQMDRVQNPADQIVNNTLLSGTTHTYRNRGFKGAYQDWWARIFTNMGIPREYHWLMVNSEKQVDMASIGLRGSDYTKGVSGIHAYEVQGYDPMLKMLYGVTNGDDLNYSTTQFRNIYHEKYGDKSQSETTFDQMARSITTFQINEVKKEAKRKLGELLLGKKNEILKAEGILTDTNPIDPNLMVVSYSGRFVPEKGGRNRAFVDENLRVLLGKGVQVVIFGNVQPYPASEDMGRKMRKLANKLNREMETNGKKGKLIFIPSFSIDEQIALLAASDVQVQDSERRTGACEYTEADVSANCGLQFSPPFWEGLIGIQGEPINYKEGSGNTVIPSDSTPEAYLESFEMLVDLYNSGDILKYQLNSIYISNVLEASQVAAEYIKQWATNVENKSIITEYPYFRFRVITDGSGSKKIRILVHPKNRDVVPNVIRWGTADSTLSNAPWYNIQDDILLFDEKSGYYIAERDIPFGNQFISFAINYKGGQWDNNRVYSDKHQGYIVKNYHIDVSNIPQFKAEPVIVEPLPVAVESST